MTKKPTCEELDQRVNESEQSIGDQADFEKASLGLRQIDEAMERIHRTIESSHNLDVMLEKIIEDILHIFQSDRSWLLHPCDPDATSINVTFESTQPDYPGQKVHGKEIPMTADMVDSIRRALAVKGDVRVDPPPGHAISNEIAIRLNVKSRIFMALHPKTGSPWLFGLHQCDHQRHWTDAEILLFQRIGFRISDALNNMLYLRQLKQSERQYRHLFESALDAIFLIDLETHKILDCNQKAVEMDGYSYEELTQLTLVDIYPESQREQIPIITKAIREQGHLENISDIHHLRKDGTLVPVEINSRLIDFQNKKVALAHVRDISERKQVETALMESEQKWRNILVKTPQIGIALNPKGQIIFANEHFLETTGWKKEEIIGQNWFDLFMPESIREEIRGVFRKVISQGDTLGISTYENEILTKSGELRIIAWSNVLTKDTHGNIADVTCLGIDLTERRRAEEELRNSEEKYRLLVENQTGLVVKLGIEGRFSFVSPSFCMMFGKTEDALIGQPFMPLVHEDDRESTEKAMEALLSPPHTAHMEHRALTKDGWRWLAWADTAILDDEGRVKEIIGAGRDITERKLAEEDQEKLQHQLLQAQKMESVGRLAGGVAHDFNNILSIIIGNAELMLEDMDTADPLLDNLREILNAAKRSADLTRQLLAFARKQTISPKALDLNKTLEGLLKILRRLIGEDIDLAWLPNNKLWPVKMDPTQIDQILANLCINARDSITNSGKVTIETDNVELNDAYCNEHEGFKTGDFVLIAVNDNGCGMDKKTVKNIFEPFYTTKDVGRGTGLGLATVYGIVKQNNGFINVYSEPGMGTTFKLYLPRHTEKAGKTQPNRTEMAAEGGHETILVVEDEKAILKMTATILQRLGYNVLAASSPKEAVRTAEFFSSRIDLLITDVVMPGMGGRELAQSLLESYPDMKCLFMSGYSTDVIAHHGVLDKGVEFIKKPFILKDLAAKVRSVLDKQSKH